MIFLFGSLYCWLVISELIEEIKFQQPDKKDEFSFSNYFKLIEIFFPMTQVSFLGM